MICPFRVDKVYETERIGDAVVMSAVREKYAECHGPECPCYICEGYCLWIEKREWRR